MPGTALRVLVIDAPSASREVVLAALRGLADVADVLVREPPATPGPGVDVVVSGLGGDDAADAGWTGCATVVLVDRPDDVRAVLGRGALGLLSRGTLTPGRLAAAVRGAATGTSVIDPELWEAVVGPARGPRAGAVPDVRLSVREQRVLRLLAGGARTHEVAQQLSYSERTVKNVLHDVLVKLDAPSRSAAVASALRVGLI